MGIIGNFIKWILILFFGSSVLVTVTYRFIPVHITPLMIIRAMNPKGTEKQQYREKHWQHRWISYNEISCWMPKAVIASEDGNFYSHNGFDFKAIEQAVMEKRAGKRERGASTISQQTAKNVFLWPGHSWIRKGLEAYFTVLIELIWSKERIMEVYLNSIEMGAGIYGIEAASQHYFHISAGNLTKHQCALIAVCLPSPLKRDPADPSGYVSRRAKKISSFM